MVHRKIAKFESARQMKEGGGFRIRRPIGDKIDACDPFLMLDHLGPADYGPGEAVGAPDHPHRGFQTVTYLISGENTHHDSGSGSTSTLKAGDVQWMIAGSGVVHSEMPSENIIKKGGRIEGFQLWVNLPAKDKMMPPKYQDILAKDIPVIKSDDGKTTVKVISGSLNDVISSVETRIPVVVYDIHVSAGSTYTLNIPDNHNSFAYVWRGSGTFGKELKSAKLGDVVVLSEDGDEFQFSASSNEDMHIMFCGGIQIKEPIARRGPFVMNTMEEIQQAFIDYQNGKLGSIDGSEERYAKTRAAVAQQKKNNTY